MSQRELNSRCFWQERFQKRNAKRAVPLTYYSEIIKSDGSKGWQGGKRLARSAEYTPAFCKAVYSCWVQAQPSQEWFVPLGNVAAVGVASKRGSFMLWKYPTKIYKKSKNTKNPIQSRSWSHHQNVGLIFPYRVQCPHVLDCGICRGFTERGQAEERERGQFGLELNMLFSKGTCGLLGPACCSGSRTPTSRSTSWKCPAYWGTCSFGGNDWAELTL